MNFRRKGQRGVRYWFVDARCISAACWAPGIYQSRGATTSGSRNTGGETPRCLNNAYHGCPQPEEKRGYSDELVKLRRKEGWTRA